MNEMAPDAAKTRIERRMLGSNPVALGYAAVAAVITAGILFLQLQVRAGQYEPDTVPIFHRLFGFEDYPASFLFLLALLIAAIPKFQQVATHFALAIGEHPMGTSIASGVALAAGALWIYHAHPLSMDEAAPYMQSQIFASGALVGKFPPALLDWLVVPSFQNYFIHVSRQTGEVASSYWPGFALLLTPFTWAGVPWLCNPVIGAASVFVVHRLTLRLTASTLAAGAAALFALASAAFTVNSMTFYSMSAHLLANATFALLLLTPSPRRCLCAGSIGGLALTLHNPVPHLLFAPAWLLWLLTQKNRWSLIGAIAAGYLPWIIVVGFGWPHLLQQLSGSTPHADPGGNALATALRRFGSVFKLPGPDQIFNRLISTSKLWLWASPLVILLAANGFWRHRHNVHFKLLLASAALTFVAYLFVPLDQGHGWGYRYFHSVWFVLPVFAGAALAPPTARAQSVGIEKECATPLAAWTLAGSLAGLLVMTPWFCTAVHSFIGAHLAQLPQSTRGQARVIIINSTLGYYNVDLVQNDPFLRAPVLRMISHGPQDDTAMMVRNFPDLVLLSKEQRGYVWGYPQASAAGAAAQNAGEMAPTRPQP